MWLLYLLSRPAGLPFSAVQSTNAHGPDVVWEMLNCVAKGANHTHGLKREMVFLISDRRSRVGPSVIEISALTSLNYSFNSDFLGLSWLESYQGREGDGSTEENRALGDGFEISVWRTVPSWVPPCFKISGTMCEFTTPLE